MWSIIFEIVSEIVITVGWLGSGFVLGRMYESKYGYLRKAYKEAMDGWKEAIDLLKVVAEQLRAKSPPSV